MAASTALGYGYSWAVESRSQEGRVYLVTRLQDGRWICSGHYMDGHCGPDKECWHIASKRTEWEAGRRELESNLRLVPGGAA